MTKGLKYASFLTAAIMLLGLASCRKDEPSGSGNAKEGEDTYIVLSLAMPGAGNTSTKAQSEWIQKVTLGNVHVGIFEQDEPGKKLIALMDYPGTFADKCVIGSNEYYQVAWKITDKYPAVIEDIEENPGKKYKIVVGVNHPDQKTWNNVYGKNDVTWETIMNPESTSGQKVFSYLNMSRAGDPATSPYLYRGIASDKSFKGDDVNMWMSPIMTGTIERITLGKGVNLIGFTPQGGSFKPAIDLAKVNSDMGTSYTAVPWCRDATENDASSHELALTPCYAQLIVNSISNEVPDKFTLTDIFVMNTPMRFSAYAPDITCYFNTQDITNNLSSKTDGLNFSTGRSLLSGFLPDWLDPDVMGKDNFVRFLHYPVSADVKYDNFSSNYTASGYYATPSSQLAKLVITNINTNTAITIPTDKSNGVVKRMEENLTTWNSTFWKNNPIFLIAQNDGEYPSETTKNKLGERQYRYATRLVLRGTWQENFDSPKEFVYYPILVNYKDPVYDTSYDSETAETEKNKLVKRGRRYIYDITIRNKGVSNPWTDADIDVSLGSISLKVMTWKYADVELPKFIY